MNKQFTVDLIDLNAKLILTMDGATIVSNYVEYIGSESNQIDLTAIFTEQSDNYEKVASVETFVNDNLLRIHQLLTATEQVMKAINIEFNNDTFLIFN